MIPPGAMLMKNEQGQLMFVTANQPGQHPGAVGGTRIQYVRVGNSAASKMAVINIEQG